MLKKLICLIILLVSISTAIAFPSPIFDTDIYYTELLPFSYDLNGNSTTFGINGTVYTTVYNNSITRNSQLNYKDTLLSPKISAYRAEIQCYSIKEYNRIYGTTLNKITLIYGKNNFGGGNTRVEFDYNEITDVDNKKTYYYVSTLEQDTQAFIKVILDFTGQPNLINTPCHAVWYTQSQDGDSIDYNGQTKNQIENQEAQTIQAYHSEIKYWFSQITQIIVEFLLVSYWIIKILVVVTVLGMIVWIFMWFYQLVKKLLG